MSDWTDILIYVTTEVAKALLKKAIEYGVRWAIAQYRSGWRP